MGHRASVAYVHPTDGTVRAHYSHWGAYNFELLEELTPDAPFGAGSLEPAFVRELRTQLDLLAEQTGANVAHGGEGSGGSVDTDSYANYDDLEEWATEGVNFLMHEAAYVVTFEPWNVRAFDTVWYRGEEGHHGLLVECDGPDEWGTYANLTYDLPEDVSKEEFEQAVRENAGDRIPEWSVLP